MARAASPEASTAEVSLSLQATAIGAEAGGGVDAGISLDQLRLGPTQPGESGRPYPGQTVGSAFGVTVLGRLGATSVLATPTGAGGGWITSHWSTPLRLETRVLSPLKLAMTGGRAFRSPAVPTGERGRLRLPSQWVENLTGMLVEQGSSAPQIRWTAQDRSSLPAPVGGMGEADLGQTSVAPAEGRRLVLAYSQPLGMVVHADYQPAQGVQAAQASLGADYQTKVSLGTGTAARLSASASVGVDLGELAHHGKLRLPHLPTVQAGMAYEMGDKATLTATYRIDADGIRLERSTQVGIGLSLTDSTSLSASYRLVRFSADTGPDQVEGEAQASLKVNF